MAQNNRHTAAVRSANNGCFYTLAGIGVLLVLTCTGLIVPLFGVLFLCTGFFGSVWLIGYALGAVKSSSSSRATGADNGARPMPSASADPWVNPRNTPFEM